MSDAPTPPPQPPPPLPEPASVTAARQLAEEAGLRVRRDGRLPPRHARRR